MFTVSNYSQFCPPGPPVIGLQNCKSGMYLYTPPDCVGIDILVLVGLTTPFYNRDASVWNGVFIYQNNELYRPETKDWDSVTLVPFYGNITLENLPERSKTFTGA